MGSCSSCVCSFSETAVHRLVCLRDESRCRSSGLIQRRQMNYILNSGDIKKRSSVRWISISWFYYDIDHNKFLFLDWLTKRTSKTARLRSTTTVKGTTSTETKPLTSPSLIVSLAAVSWMSRNVPFLLGERCVTFKKRLRARLLLSPPLELQPKRN